MKKLLIICFCFTAMLAKSQDSTRFIVADPDAPTADYRFIIKFSPVEFLFSRFQMGFEHNTGPIGSFQINAALTYVDNQNKYKEGYMGEFQFRSYVLGRQADNHGPLNNLYVAPFANYKHFTIKDWNTIYDYWGYPTSGVTTDNFNAFGLGLIAGLNTIIANRFHLDIYVGGGIRVSDSKYNDSNITQEGYKGIAPRFGLDVGVNF
jgi:hypothetical protein